jgi:NADPH:quinone reductase-like Zn-dependent oxidoreductase
MKAIICTKYGSVDNFHLEEVPKPVPKDNEVLIKIRAASMNAADLEILHGAWSARMVGPLRPRNKIPGSDVAGVVEAVGGNVTKFKPGDEVFGDTLMRGFGAFAEYVSVSEEILEPKPPSMTFEEIATYPQSGLIALQSLRGKKQIKKGDKVLINGAGGGMGSFGVQIAKYYGAEVTAVDGPTKLDMIRSLGADHVIDYTKENYTKSGKRFDLVVDVVAHNSVFAFKRVLGPDGRFVVVGGSKSSIFQVIFLGPLLTIGSKKKLGLNPIKTNPKEDMAFLVKLFEAGLVKPVIDRRFALEEVPEAFRYFEEGHVKGKIVITMDYNDKA